MFARAGSQNSLSGMPVSRRKRKSGSPPARRDSSDVDVQNPRLESVDELVTKMKAGESKLLVVSRVRPLSKKEKTVRKREVAKVLGGKVVVLLDPNEDLDDVLRKNRSREKRYAFDQAFGPSTSQTEVYEKSCKFLLEGVLSGYNATVFAYGATGAGKTYTMVGTEAQPGVMAMTISDLFALMDNDENPVDYKVSVTYVELYNEAIRDLLVHDSPDLELREDADGNSVVCGLERVEISSAGQMMSLLQAGNRRRTQEATGANQASSRSHAILEVQIDRTSTIVEKNKVVHSGRLFMIDLAGSERASSTMNNGQRMVEGQHINRSLLALGNCINALGGGHRAKYVNFRDSKLTRILKPSLGGNCRTVMIACISPATHHFEETYNTMNYANRAKNIKNTVVANESVVQAHVAEYGRIIDGLKEQVLLLQSQLANRDTTPAVARSNSLQSRRESQGMLSAGTAKMVSQIEEACQQEVMTKKKLELLSLKDGDLNVQRDIITAKIKRHKGKGSSGGDEPISNLTKKELNSLKKEVKQLDDALKANASSRATLLQKSGSQSTLIERLSQQLESTSARPLCKNIVKIKDLEIQNLTLSFAATVQRNQVASRVVARNDDLRDRIIAEQKALLDRLLDRPPTPLAALYSQYDGKPFINGYVGQEDPRPGSAGHAISMDESPDSASPSPDVVHIANRGIGGRQKSELNSRSTRHEGAPPAGTRRLSFDATTMQQGASRDNNVPKVSKSRVQSGVSIAAGSVAPGIDRDSSHSSMEDNSAMSDAKARRNTHTVSHSSQLSRTYNKADLSAAILAQTYNVSDKEEHEHVAGSANTPPGTGGTDMPSELSQTYSKSQPMVTAPAGAASSQPSVPVVTEDSSAEVDNAGPLVMMGTAAGSMPPWQKGLAGARVPAHKQSRVPAGTANSKLKLRGAKPRMGQQRRARIKSKGLVHPAAYGNMLGLSVQSSPYAQSTRKK